MRTSTVVRTIALALLAAGVGLCPAGAATFDSDFQVVKIGGSCSFRLPRQSAFAETVAGQRLPYGTVIRTEDGSSAVIRLSSGNGCRIGAATTVAIEPDPAVKKGLVLRISEQGYVRVILEEGFRQNNELKVETPSATCIAIHCDFSVEHKTIGDLRTSIISCTKGEISVIGECFSMVELTAGEQVTVAQSPDGKFVRIKMVLGDTEMTIADSDGSARKLALAAGDEIQILVEDSREKPGVMIVIYKIDYADPSRKSELVQAEVPRKKAARKAVAAATPPAGDVSEGEDWPLLTVSSPLPEKPSVTPVGVR